jgi:putative hydrolase of the HAD superfamily
MEDVQKAFQRVGLDQYLSGYFCFANLGIAKNQPDFYLAVAEQLSAEPSQLTMVGDLPEKDIYPAMDAGLNVVWFNPQGLPAPSKPISNQIRCLSELLRT